MLERLEEIESRFAEVLAQMGDPDVVSNVRMYRELAAEHRNLTPIVEASTTLREKMEELEVPNVREMIQMISDAGCRIFACELAMNMMDLKLGDLLPQVDSVLTAEDFYKETVGADIVFV